jgi:hypothetical protein
MLLRIGIFCLLFCQAFCLSLHAQLSKGTHSLGASLILTRNSYPDLEMTDSLGNTTFIRRINTSYGIGLNGMQFVSDRLALGMGAEISLRQRKDPQFLQGTVIENRTNTVTTGLMLNARYHVPLREKLYFFIDARGDGAISRITSHRTQNDSVRSFSQNEQYLELSVNPGIVYMLTKHWGLEVWVRCIQMGFRWDDWQQPYQYLSVDFPQVGQFHLGIRYYWGGRNKAGAGICSLFDD